MSKILIVKNITHEGPGLLEELLIERNIDYTVIDLHKGQNFPETSNFQAVVVLGGPDSANDQNAKMENELKQIREIIDSKKPYLGICLGLQTLIKSAGGKVVKSPLKEVGFIDPDGNNFIIELTDQGKQDPLFKNLDNILNVFHLHGETVELTNEMQLLGVGKFCKNQIVRVGQNAYGIQCHFELTPEMFKSWIEIDPDLRELDIEQLKFEYTKIKENYTYTGQQLFKNFLDIAGFF